MARIAEHIRPRRAGPDRDHRRPGHHRAGRLPDHEEGLRAARHPLRAAAGAQLRARHAGPELRRLHPRFLARVQRRQRRGPAARRASSSTEVLNTEEFPLTVLDRPIESETAKIVENSYRATILAFLDEWSLFAERNGVDLKKVIEAIKVRPTHSNIIFPGPGIGGYCLPKDGGLGVWAYRHILGWEDDIFKITPLAIDINDTRALHAPAAGARRPAQHGQAARGGRGPPARRLLPRGRGRHPLQRLGDHRAPARRDGRRTCGCTIPYVEHWWEFEAQDTYPHPATAWPGSSTARSRSRICASSQDLWKALKGVDAVVLAVRHEPYLDLDPDDGRQGRRQAVRARRLLLHPRRRPDPPLPRAGLRGQGHGTRAHQADQGKPGDGARLTRARPAGVSGPRTDAP